MNWETIKRRKERAQLTWGVLAFEAGITRRTLVNWRNDSTAPDPHKFKAFMDTLERLERQQERKR